MNSIVVATDFSREAARAQAVAQALARRSGDRLAIVHVMDDWLLEQAAGWSEAHDRPRSELHASAEIARRRGLEVEERLESGDPAEVVTAAARELGSRLIVTGSHGRRPLARWVLGSVTRGILALTDRPVLVARADQELDPTERWGAGTRPLRVLVAMDRSPGAGAALAWAGWLRGLGQIELRLAHVFDPLLTALRLGLRPGEPTDDDYSSTMERELRGRAAELPGDGPLHFAMLATPDRPAEVIVREVVRTGADLLVVGTHQRTGLQRIWLGATSELLLRLCPVPVVCVPAVSRARLEDSRRTDELC